VALLWTGSLLITALVVVLALAAAMQLAPLFGSIGLAAAVVCAGLFALALAVGLAARSLIRPPRTPTGAIMRWILTDGERDGPRA
jgi:O-antigen/teichoic acid export membrane protein